MPCSLEHNGGDAAKMETWRFFDEDELPFDVLMSQGCLVWSSRGQLQGPNGQRSAIAHVKVH